MTIIFEHCHVVNQLPCFETDAESLECPGRQLANPRMEPHLLMLLNQSNLEIIRDHRLEAHGVNRALRPDVSTSTSS